MDRYAVGELIGRGNFGEVRLCVDKRTGKHAVMKRISMAGLSPEEQQAAMQEASLLQSMGHPCIVSYFDSFMHEDQLVLVMEYCAGGDLRQVISEHARTGSPIPEGQILEWLVQLTLALQMCHSRRVIHRDIKPQNVFLSRQFQAKLGDFGIARQLSGTSELATSVVGTPYSMSPEICNNQPYGFASDVWSLGCLIYEMATLRHAFDANNLLGLVWKIVQEEVPPISDMYSADLRGLVAAMLQKDPARRPTISEILATPFVREHMARQQQINEERLLRKRDSSGSLSLRSTGSELQLQAPSAGPPEFDAEAAQTVRRPGPAAFAPQQELPLSPPPPPPPPPQYVPEYGGPAGPARRPMSSQTGHRAALSVGDPRYYSAAGAQQGAAPYPPAPAGAAAAAGPQHHRPGSAAPSVQSSSQTTHEMMMARKMQRADLEMERQWSQRAEIAEEALRAGEEARRRKVSDLWGSDALAKMSGAAQGQLTPRTPPTGERARSAHSGGRSSRGSYYDPVSPTPDDAQQQSSRPDTPQSRGPPQRGPLYNQADERPLPRASSGTRVRSPVVGVSSPRSPVDPGYGSAASGGAAQLGAGGPAAVPPQQRGHGHRLGSDASSLSSDYPGYDYRLGGAGRPPQQPYAPSHMFQPQQPLPPQQQFQHVEEETYSDGFEEEAERSWTGEGEAASKWSPVGAVQSASDGSSREDRPIQSMAGRATEWESKARDVLGDRYAMAVQFFSDQMDRKPDVGRMEDLFPDVATNKELKRALFDVEQAVIGRNVPVPTATRYDVQPPQQVGRRVHPAHGGHPQERRGPYRSQNYT